MKIERFEDIQAWQEARVLTQMVYAVSTKGRFTRDRPLASQIQAAAGSVMNNITAEEFTAIYEKATEAKKLINGLIRYLCQSPQQSQRTT